MVGQNLLLLHGALGASDQFTNLTPLLRERYNVLLLDFEGHGAVRPTERPFSIEHFTENVREYLDGQDVESAHVFGYSMGGYVACSLALTHPQLVRSIATLGTKFYWDREVAAREVGLLNPEKISAKVPHFARALAERHAAAGWEAVLARTREMLLSLGERGGLRPEDVAHLEQRVRVMIGDRDATVTFEESRDIYRALPNGELQVLPGTPHQFESVPVAALAYSLSEFFG